MEKCDHFKRYCRKYDAYYCPQCDVWMEDRCKDQNCEFCVKRPEKPSQVSEEKN